MLVISTASLPPPSLSFDQEFGLMSSSDPQQQLIQRINLPPCTEKQSEDQGLEWVCST
jgi:hypothetical protein